MAFHHGIWVQLSNLILALILFWQSNWKMMIKNIHNEVLQIYRTFCSYDSGSTGHFISKALFVIGKKLSTNLNFYQLTLLQQAQQFDLFWTCAKPGYSQVSGFSFIDSGGVLEVSDSPESDRFSLIYVPRLFSHVTLYMLMLLGSQQETNRILTQ